MRPLLKWLGFALVAFGITVFPFAVWFPGPWGVMSLLLVMFGCILLVAVAAGRFPRDEPSFPPEDGYSAEDKAKIER